MVQDQLKQLIEDDKFLECMAEAVSFNETMRKAIPEFADLTTEEKIEKIRSVFALATPEMMAELVRNADMLASAQQRDDAQI